MINFFLGLFSYDLAIDLGTANTLVYVRGKGIAVRESTTVARNRRTKETLAIGNAASKMFGKTGKTIEVVRPLRAGVISDFSASAVLLSHFIHKVHQSGTLHPRIPRPHVVIGIPSGITQVERRAVTEVALKAGARKVDLVSEAVAAAVGSFKSFSAESTCSVIDIGGGTTDIALISDGREVESVSLRVAGDAMDERIIEFVKLQYSLLIGVPTAERTKIALADARPGKEVYQVVRGRDLETGLPRSIRMTNFEIYEALSPAIEEILSAAVHLFEEAPPELVSEVMETGLMLCGGGALIRNLDVVLAERLNLKVSISEDPLTSVVRGCGKLLNDRALLKKVSYTDRIR